MATLRDVAVRAGVDVSTASKVLSGREIRVADRTRKRIEAAARALDYTPNAYAQGLRLRRRGALAMAVRNTTSYVFPEIVEGGEEAADRLGINLFLVRQPEGDASDRLLSVIRQGRMDGWIFADESPREGFFDELATARVPFITLNRYADGPGPHVCLNDEAGFTLQANQIAAAGHRKVAFVGVRPASFISRYCAETFVKQMARKHVAIPKSHQLSALFTGDDADEAAEALLRLHPRPTAVACGSAQIGIRLMEALTQRGVRIPHEMSVVGYHDIEQAAQARVPLTTVRMPSRTQGRRAVDRLTEMIECGTTEFAGETVDVAPEWILRGSLASVS